MTRTALVTGGAGFVGRHMVRALLAGGWDVHSVDLEPMDVVVDWSGPAHLHVVQDALRYFASATAFTFDLVVHAAARAPHRAAIDSQPSAGIYNRMLDAAMFEWAVRTGQRRVLYLSSSAVYPAGAQRGHVAYRLAEDDAWTGQSVSRGLLEALDEMTDIGPFDSYGWAKLAGEQMAEQAREAGVPVTVVRPFSGYGEDQNEDFPFGAFVARARRREDPFRIWGDGSQVRDWLHVDDLVRGALAVVEAGVREPVNLCTGVGTSMADLAGAVCSAAGYSPGFEFDLTAPRGVAYRVGDPTRMRKVYTPRISLAEGVARAFAAVRA